ncbi:MAG TPA: GLUG motif-containing protein, partial [Wenzhouxiangella sp.]
PAITDSYATGKIQGLADIGGLVGDMFSGIIVSSFAAVEVTGSSGAVPSTLGGFFGFQNQGVLVTRSYWSPEISGRSSSGSLDAQASVQSRTKAQMLGNAATTHMSDLNFNNTWQTTLSSANRCTIGLPELRVLAYRPSPFAESTLSGGTGAIDDPCLIEDWNDLHKTRDHLSAAFALNGNLDNQTAGYADRVTNPSGGFGPIGTSSIPFTGSFNGRGHTIDGLEINRGSENHVGLFAALGTGATVDALALTNVSITGKNTVGGLAGEIQTNATVTGVTIGGTVTSTETGSPSLVGGLAGTNQGQITDATSAAVVSGQSTTVGGLVGQNNSGTIQASSASGAVTGKGFVGGLVGRSQSGQITQSFATGNVTATEPFNNNTVSGLGMAGGLAGEIHLSDRLEQTASTGDIQGGLVGGLVGYAFGGAPLLPQITDSYSASTLIESPSVAGGLVGKIESAELERVYFIGADQTSNGLTSLVGQATNASVTQAYWDSDTTGIVANAQTLGEGKTTQALINRNTYSGWDFNSVWGIGGTREITYPFLRNIGNLDRPNVLLKLVSSTPDHNATGVALSPNEVLLTFNLNVEIGDPLAILISRNGQRVYQWGATTFDQKTPRLRFQFQPNSTYRIALRPSAIRARANSRVSNEETIVVSFTTVPFANGDGTQASPYQIKSTTDWVNFTKSSDLWDKHFVLTQNINFPTTANRIIRLSPIGPFSGTLDGQGHFISNAVVQDLNSVDVGLFKSITSTGSIKDLHLVNAKVTGTQTTGLMAG